MSRSSFVQPLPPSLAPSVSKGYKRASEPAQSFEIIGLVPAGGLSSTGADMARFMIAHLSNGGPLLDPATARQMYAVQNRPVPGLPGMALGFYHEDRNGLTIIGHAGDTDQFHSDLHLYLDKGVGIYMSFNSGGKDGAAHVVRENLFANFTDRYFPAAAQPSLQAAASARADGAALAGHYVSSRASGWNFLRLVNLLGQTNVSVNDDATITVSTLVDAAGVPKKWREVAPWQWAEIGGSDRLAAVVRNGKVELFSIAGFAPIIEFLPAPFDLNAGWIIPLLLAGLAVALLTALSWPIVALVRRRYAYTGLLAGRPLAIHRATRVTAWVIVAVAGGWLALLQTVNNDVSALDGRLDLWMRILQLLTIIEICGALLAVWAALLAFRRPGWFSRSWAVLFALAAIFLAWVALDTGLLTPGLDF